MQFAAEIVGEAPIGLADEIHRRQRRKAKRGRSLAREQSDGRVDIGLLAGVEIEAEGAGRRFAVEQRIDDDMLGHRVRRLDPEFAEERELLVEARSGADRKAPRREAIALSPAKEAEVARAEEGDHFVPDMRRVDREFETKAGEPEVDRQHPKLGVAVVEQIGGVGDRRRDAVAQHVDDHRTLVEMPEMEQFQPEIGPLLAEQRLVGFEADVAPGVEIEVRQAVGQRRNRAVEGRGGEVARPLDDVRVAEGGRQRPPAARRSAARRRPPNSRRKRPQC